MDPIVDIVIAVYNHVAYLKQALDSVLAQKTTFPIRLIIADDHSTDGSAEIVKDYETRFPDKIVAIYQKRNLGLNGPERNGGIALNRATAKYVAMLDGDDYWVDTLKLQKQVDFLEQNPDFSFCYHHVNIIQEANFKNQKLEMKKGQPDTSTLEDLLKLRIWAHVNSVLYRQKSMPQYPPWLNYCPSTDWAILCIVTGNGKIKYMKESMSVYRQHGGGEWSSSTEIQNHYRIVKTAKAIKKYLLKGENRKYIYWPLTDCYREISNYYKTTHPLKSLYFKTLSIIWGKRYELAVRWETLKKTT